MVKWLSLIRKNFCGKWLSYPVSISITQDTKKGIMKNDLRFENAVGGLVQFILAIGFVIVLMIVGCDIRKCFLPELKREVAAARSQVQEVTSTTEELKKQVEQLTSTLTALEGSLKNMGIVILRSTPVPVTSLIVREDDSPSKDKKNPDKDKP
ncbi:MAG: hypothetical protein ACI4QD_02545 [Kiritimatiellia bacterium]